MALELHPPYPPMEALSVDEIPAGDEWQYEPKWDGFRCLVFRTGSEVELRAKSGKSLNRFFPDVVRVIGALEVLGAIGIVLPALSGILPRLTPLAALGLVLTMIGAALTHLRRKEHGGIAVNAVLLILAAFVAYGRFFVLPA